MDTQKEKHKFNYDDKDLAMVGIVILCVFGGIACIVLSAPATVMVSLFTGGVTALGSLASGRKNE